jgi:ribonuclease G
MTSEVIVDVTKQDISIALLEDKRLVEFQREGRSEHFSVGNIYLAKVRKLMPGLNACFVNVGYERDAFLHYLDLGTRYKTQEKFLQMLGDGRRNISLDKVAKQPEIEKEGTIQSTLKVGQEILVQIVKEPISTKGPRLTSELSFAGRFLVLIPFSDKVSVSSKIKSGAERARLKQLIQSIKPKGFGVIIRTVAEGMRVAELDNEMQMLLTRWNNTVAKIKQSRSEAMILPQLVYEETSRTVALLRDLFNPSYENIYVNDQSVFDEVRNYVSLIAPECKDIVKFYKGSVPIFDNFSVTKQIKTSLGRTVTYKHGLPYLGIGPGAHSYDGKRTRRYNLPNLKAYAEAKNGNVGHSIEVLTEAEAFDELLFTSLRTREGLNLEGIKARFPEKWISQILNDAQPHIVAGRLSLIGNRLVLTQKGIMTSNDVISDLMRAE